MFDRFFHGKLDGAGKVGIRFFGPLREEVSWEMRKLEVEATSVEEVVMNPVSSEWLEVGVRSVGLDWNMTMKVGMCWGQPIRGYIDSEMRIVGVEIIVVYFLEPFQIDE